MVEKEYEARPILETDCFKEKVNNRIPYSTAEEQQECFKALTAVCGDSSLTRHLKGRYFATPTNQSTMTNEVPESLTSILNIAGASNFLPSLDIDTSIYNLKTCCKEVLEAITNVDIGNVALNYVQNSEDWFRERKLRITGSKCYSLYTYNKEDWHQKATSYFWPRKITNKYVEHGKKYEKKKTLQVYTSNNNYEVHEPGLVICKLYPWLAYSPDAIVMKNGVPSRLVEIKCPYEGINVDAVEFIHTCKYLKLTSENGLRLKQKHSYCGQVQLGMAVLNLDVCDLVLYSSKTQSFLNIVVHFNKDFARDLICTVTNKYFKFMLHAVCERKG